MFSKTFEHLTPRLKHLFLICSAFKRCFTQASYQKSFFLYRTRQKSGTLIEYWVIIHEPRSKRNILVVIWKGLQMSTSYWHCMIQYYLNSIGGLYVPYCCQISRDYYFVIVIELVVMVRKVEESMNIEHVFWLILTRTEKINVPKSHLVVVYAISGAYARDQKSANDRKLHFEIMGICFIQC